MINNSINTGPMATATQAKAGTDTRNTISPATALSAINARGLAYSNFNLAVNTSQFLVTATGATLSATAYGTVSIPSKLNPGQSKAYKISATQFLGVQGLFGTSSGVAWGSACPFYVYCAANDAETAVTFFVSRVPSRVTVPTAANIGSTSGTNCTTQGSFYTSASITTTDYENNPCVLIGSFRATKDAGNTWSGFTFNDIDGMQMYNNNELYTFPALQFGATLDHFRPNGGTSPNYLFSNSFYQVFSDGTCYVYFNAGSVVSAGVGAVNLQCTVPFVSEQNGVPLEPCQSLIGATNVYMYPIMTSSNYVEFRRWNTSAPLLYSEALANLTMMIRYKISNA